MFGFHYRLERSAMGLVAFIVIVASIGGLVEIAPLFTIDETVEQAEDMRVYTPLEVAGRNIFIREGCYACHSQMIRTLRDEVERYGPYSLAVESSYDHPQLWLKSVNRSVTPAPMPTAAKSFDCVAMNAAPSPP